MEVARWPSAKNKRVTAGEENDRAPVTDESGVSSAIAPTEIGVLWRSFRIRMKSK